MTRDRMIGAVVIGGSFLAIWLYAEFSPFQQCRREKMAEFTEIPIERRSQTASKVCAVLTE